MKDNQINDDKNQEQKYSNESLTLEQIQEFFKATEDGSVERLDQLFHERRNANPNMTLFKESLLMAAIRRNRHDVADYLIDQLAVNVDYGAELREFRARSRIPCRHRTFTCRDLAYEKGMMELVDLIDLTSKDVKPNIKRYLKARLQPRLNHIHQTFFKRLPQQKHQLFQSNQTSFKSSSYRSFIEESIENLGISSKDKSIDETGKKTFRFSNYTLRFRFDEKRQTKKENEGKSLLKTTYPTHSTTSLFASTSTPSFINYTTPHPVNPINLRRSICSSKRQTTLPQIRPVGKKQSTKNSIQHLL